MSDLCLLAAVCVGGSAVFLLGPHLLLHLYVHAFMSGRD